MKYRHKGAEMPNLLDWIRGLIQRNLTEDAPETVFLGGEASVGDELIADLQEFGQPEEQSPQY